MTIFAVVNHLIHRHTLGEESESIWTVISPSSILQGGNPYFVPDFASRFEARAALAIRIGKLGKGVATRFASRYVDAVAPAVQFVAADMLDMLREKGLPWTQAISYDRALAIGKFQPVDFDRISDCRLTLTLRSDQSEEDAFDYGLPVCTSLAETIQAISRDNTLKTGDIILIGLVGEGPEVKPSLRVSLSLDGQASLRFNIR